MPGSEDGAKVILGVEDLADNKLYPNVARSYTPEPEGRS